jgi:hypothetical protein
MSDQAIAIVIVPAYRAEATLPGGVHTLLAPTCPSWQVIVASDHGVDYRATLKRVGIRDDRLQQASRDAGGSGEAAGGTAACGATLCNLDADDEFRVDRREPLAPLALAQAPENAERGHGAIRHLLESGAPRLSKEWRAAAHAEFTANRCVNRPYRQRIRGGRCASLEDLLNMAQNGRPPWADAELTGLSEEPARAA